MSKIHILNGEFSEHKPLQFAPGIKAGFMLTVHGESMIEAGISDGDIAVIDRSLEPHHNDIVVAFVNEEFTIKQLDLSHKEEGYILLRPANKRYQPIHIDAGDDFEVWGVVVYTIKPWN